MTEQTLKCVVCQRRTPHLGIVCTGDVERIKADLAEIVALVGKLGAVEPARDLRLHPATEPLIGPLLRGQRRPRVLTGAAALDDPVAGSLPTHANGARVGGQRVSGSTEPGLPVRVRAVDLTLPASTGSLVPDRRGTVYVDDQTGDQPVATVLASWVRDWADHRGEGERPPAANVGTLAAWLEVRLEAACGWDATQPAHPAIDEFAAEIRDTVLALRHVAEEASDREELGPCPVALDTGWCGAKLYGSPWLDVVECRRCGTRWGRAQWFVLGAAIQQAIRERAG